MEIKLEMDDGFRAGWEQELPEPEEEIEEETFIGHRGIVYHKKPHVENR